MTDTPDPPAPVCRCRRYFIAAGAAFAVWLLYQYGGEWVQKVRTPSTRTIIRHTLLEQAEWWNEGNLERFMATYWNSDDLTFFSGGTVTRGWQATLDRYRKRYQADGAEMGKLEFPDLEIDVLAADAAVVRGRWELTTSMGNAGGLFTLIVRKFPAGWKIVHDHTSASEPKK